jgi:hypothetical protein
VPTMPSRLQLPVQSVPTMPSRLQLPVQSVPITITTNIVS